jgi:hypothetical protein
MYDVFLTTPCLTLPNLSFFVGQHALLAHPDFAQGCLQLPPRNFLGLDLERSLALTLLHQLSGAGAMGAVAPTRYRQPRISIEAATPLAVEAITALQKRYFPADTFEPVTFRQQAATTWIFAAPCLRLIVEGYAPGRLCVAIDKLDGYVWQDEDLMREVLEPF